MRNTLAKGGAACRPLVAEGLSAAFIDPALTYIAERGGTAAFGRRLRAIAFEPGRAAALDFGGAPIALAENDDVILAVPPWIAAPLVPGLDAPDEFRAILNAHFRVALPPSSRRSSG